MNDATQVLDSPQITSAEDSDTHKIKPVDSRWETHLGRNWGRWKASVFFGKHIYGFDQSNGRLYPFRGTVRPDGKVDDFKNLPSIPHKSFKSSYTSCVLDGKLYFFYDFDKGDWKYEIHYLTSTDPEKENLWQPARTDKGYETGLKCSYQSWPTFGSVANFQACVMDGKIYLFYFRDDQIYFASFDGKNWSEHRAVAPSKKHEIHFSVVSVMRNFKPCICLVSQESSRRDHFIISYIEPNHRVTYPAVAIKHDWVGNDAPLSVAQGTVPGGMLGNVVQIYANPSKPARNPQLRRLEMNLDTGAQSKWMDTGIRHEWSPYARHEAIAVPVPITEDTKKRNFRHFVVVQTFEKKDLWALRRFSAFKSDQFIADFETPTAIDMQEEEGTWTLVGVVEGVPPFARNGQPNSLANAAFKYGTANLQEMTVIQTHATSIGMSAGISGAVGISAELEASFSVTNKMSRKVEESIEFTFKNEDFNKDGLWGYLLFSKPALKNRNYTRYSADRLRKIGGFAVTWVEKIDLQIRAYELEKPEEGMRPRRPSTDLKYWKEPRFGTYPGIRIRPTHQLVLDSHGVSSEVALALTHTKETDTGGTVGLKVSAGGTIKKLFDIGGSAGYSFTMRSQTKSEINKHIKAAGHLPSPPSEQEIISSLIVEPTWLIPEKEAEIDPQNPPYWVPKSYNQKNSIPWCISWKVVKAE